MAVGDLERLAENFTNRNLGTSPVASRVIQQAQLEGPSAALAESTASRQNQQQRRLAEFASTLRPKSAGKVRRSVGFDPKAPTALLSIQNRGQNISSGAPQRFNLNVGDGPVPSFTSLNELISYISSRPELKQIGIEGIGGNALSGAEEQALRTGLQGRFVGRFSDQVADQLSGRTNNLFGSMFRRSGGGGRQDSEVLPQPASTAESTASKVLSTGSTPDSLLQHRTKSALNTGGLGPIGIGQRLLRSLTGRK